MSRRTKTKKKQKRTELNRIESNNIRNRINFFARLLSHMFLSIFALDEWHWHERDNKTHTNVIFTHEKKNHNILDTLQIICHTTLYSLYHFCFGIVMQPERIFIHRHRVCQSCDLEFSATKSNIPHFVCSFHLIRLCLMACSCCCVFRICIYFFFFCFCFIRSSCCRHFLTFFDYFFLFLSREIIVC